MIRRANTSAKFDVTDRSSIQNLSTNQTTDGTHTLGSVQGRSARAYNNHVTNTHSQDSHNTCAFASPSGAAVSGRSAASTRVSSLPYSPRVTERSER